MAAAVSEALRGASLGEAAVAYARAGVPVFPCLTSGKAPLVRRGFRDASRDLRQVAAWWRRWPEANIGVPTGAPSDVDVVDVDLHADRSGFAAFERARRLGLVSSWELLVRTPSGGVHAYFPHAAEQRCWALPGARVDFRGDGGYVVVAPSRVRVTPDVVRPYELLLVARRAPAPVDASALRALLDPPRPAISTPAQQSAAPERLAEWVASRPEGGRNGGLFWAACRMAEEGHDAPSILGLLGEAAQRAGLPERESSATIRSAMRQVRHRQPASGPRHRPSTREAVSL